MQRLYECEQCGNRVTIEELGTPPDCCGKPMQEMPLEACREAGPEATRPTNAEEPCQDFRGTHV
ncbi:MAG: hypothetical protein N2Z76_03180 [Treponemataceae bacterium]|nr:hypothetical protein [Treponemataceae bacterium]